MDENQILSKNGMSYKALERYQCSNKDHKNSQCNGCLNKE